MYRRDFIRLLSAVPLLPRAKADDSRFDDALALVRRIQALDDASILPVGRTALYSHGRPTDTTVVLFHGFTNCPAQYALFAQRLHARGCNVLVPRLPEHGDVNRMTTRLERMTAEQVCALAMEAVDAARGLGRRLVVHGISLGGVLTAWLVTQRGDIDRCVALSPAFGIDHIWFPLSVYAAAWMRAMPPSRYAWWNPTLKEAITPSHAYPRYPLRALGECYKIGEWTLGAQAPLAGRARTQMIFALNPRDPAVNNSVPEQLSEHWRGTGMVSSSAAWLVGFPAMHDVIEPDNPNQCVAQCYPPLLDLILG
ncbi:MAG TPA: alpha/beta fold hydrolase [Candidatus Eremiobacteraceae bacterium]|nr:alpha/beta fold hydrolase [Candidatus Eremiobacteraceae bacterium]